MSSRLGKDIIKRIVDESENPVLFKDVLKEDKGEYVWKLLSWNWDELSRKIGDVKLPFREGVNCVTSEPQWEYKCPTKHLSINEFLEISKIQDHPKWYYFDYKYMHEWFKENAELIESINWRSLGFDINSDASTIWIGNKGSHSNCHKDTYGSNLVVQIHGRKLWMLFPPNIENFRETRDPYEESTIYTKLNLFTPNLEEINHLKSLKCRPRIVILEPGDVLFVPHGWWHFVESLDTSLSVNIWFPLESDCFDRLSEALVKLVVNQIGNNIAVTSETDKNDFSECLKFIKQSLAECQMVKAKNKSKEGSHSKTDLEDIFKDYDCVTVIEEISTQEFEQFLNMRNSRFRDNETELTQTVENNNLESNIVNAFCNSKTMRTIVENLL